MKHGISLWKNVSEIKPRLGVCQFQQKMSIKNYAVLLSKVMTFLLEPVRGFISKQHVTFFFFPADFWVRCCTLVFRSGGEGGISSKTLWKFLPKRGLPPLSLRLGMHAGTAFNTSYTCDFQWITSSPRPPISGVQPCYLHVPISPAHRYVWG